MAWPILLIFLLYKQLFGVQKKSEPSTLMTSSIICKSLFSVITAVLVAKLFRWKKLKDEEENIHAKLVIYKRGICKFPFSQKVKKVEDISYSFFQLIDAMTSLAVYKEMLKYQETLQAKSSPFLLLIIGCHQCCSIYTQRLFYTAKDFSNSLFRKRSLFFSLGKTLGFLCFQYGFTLYPTDHLESLPSTISICCKKPLTARNLSDVMASRDLLNIPIPS